VTNSRGGRESYFSRLGRMVDGQHHHVSARQRGKRITAAIPTALLCLTLRLALLSPVSPTFALYWQRSRRAHG
jgi:hypothetical protein